MTLCTYSEAARRLSISPRTLDSLISRREIATVKVTGRARRISDVEIDRFIRERTQPRASNVAPFKRGAR